MVTGAASGASAGYDPTLVVLKMTGRGNLFYVLQSYYETFMFNPQAANSWANTVAPPIGTWVPVTGGNGLQFLISSQGGGWYNWTESHAFWQQYATANGLTIGTYP